MDNQRVVALRNFDGDIIITDPCYIMGDDDGWEKSNHGDNMEAIGIHNHITHDTLYGDWSCTTFNSDTKEKIGEFCADAGRVSVLLLDEVMKYNPEFDYHINKPWTTTLIKDFRGVVEFVVVHEEGVYEHTTNWYKKGEHWEDDSLRVIGKGINKSTGRDLNFIAFQTGF